MKLVIYFGFARKELLIFCYFERNLFNSCAATEPRLRETKTSLNMNPEPCAGIVPFRSKARET